MFSPDRSTVPQDRSPAGWAIEPIRRFADFNGRSRRREYWWFFLAQILVHVAFASYAFSGSAAADSSGVSDGQVLVTFVWFVFTVGMIVPNLAVIVRRCHDIEVSAWIGAGCYFGMLIFGFVGVVLLVLMLLPGKPHDNSFGPDPKGSGVADIFA